MPHLREQVAEEAVNAVEVLRPYMTAAQLDAYSRYLQECQQYIADRTKTRKKARSVSLDAYWQADVPKYHKQAAVRALKHAVADKNAAAALAQEVYKLQQKAVMIQNIRPYSRFVEAVNQVCGSSVKQDSFTKHMRG
jgi:microcystin degradation protein MlrC